MASVPSLCDILIPLQKTDCSTKGAESENTARIQLRKCHHESLGSPYTIQKFYRFLKRAHCEENLEFFEKAHQFLQLKQNSNINEDKLLAVWNNSIYLKYIAVDSPKECNFSQDTREVFETCYANGEVPADVEVLCAISHIMGLMMDGYHRFVNSVSQEEYPVPSNASDNFALEKNVKHKPTVSFSSSNAKNISGTRNQPLKMPNGTGIVMAIQKTSTDTTVESQNSSYTSQPNDYTSSVSTDSSRYSNSINGSLQKSHNLGILNSGKDLLQKLNFVKKRKSFKQPASGSFHNHYNSDIQNNAKRARQSHTTTTTASSSLPFTNKVIGQREKSVENIFQKLNLHDIN